MIRVRFRSTNYYLLQADAGLLAIDAGWPDSLHEYSIRLKQEGCRLSDIAWCVVTHFHIDHAGLVGELLERGTRCAVFDRQLEAIAEMEGLVERKGMAYRKIDLGKLEVVATRSSRTWLKRIGVDGTVLPTDAHSPDSVSLVLDDGEAFTGDLPPESQMMDDDETGKRSWRLLREHGAREIRPAHGGEYTVA